jgi:signal transduction histidine kinase
VSVHANLHPSRRPSLRGSLLIVVTAALSMLVLRGAVDDALWVSPVAVMLLALLGAVALFLYVRQRRLHELISGDRQLDLEHQVQHRTAELRELAAYLLTVREDEKAYLARELHDEMGGLLTAVKLDLARIRKLAAAHPALLERIEQVDRRLNESIAIKRRIVEDLRPSCLDTLGLSTSLSNLCADVSDRLGIPIHVEIDEVGLPPDAQLALYRLVQEGLTNVSKYARASAVRIRLQAQPTVVRLEVEDDGMGFDATQPKSATHGISGMRFRIEQLDGSLAVESTPGTGTRLVALVPIPAPHISKNMSR